MIRAILGARLRPASPIARSRRRPSRPRHFVAAIHLANVGLYAPAARFSRRTVPKVMLHCVLREALYCAFACRDTTLPTQRRANTAMDS